MQRSSIHLLVSLIFGLTLGMTFLPGKAHAWWNDDWSERKKITLDTGASGADISDPIETASGTRPVLVRLHVGNFKFEKAKQDGSDLRFVAGDDKTPLKYHVEKFDGLLGEAFVWVAVPDLKPGAQTNLFVYYGNAKADAAEDAKGTYDADQVLVYHFAERGTPAHDFSAWNNNAQTAGLPADGSLIAQGLKLDGQTTVTLPAAPSLAWTDGQALTWSAWVKMNEAQPNAVIFSRRDAANGFVIGADNGAPYVEISGAAGAQRSTAGAPLAVGTWHQIVVVAAGQQVTLYVDGMPYATLAAAVPAMSSIALVGGDSAAAVIPAPVAAPDATQPAPAAGAVATTPAPVASQAVGFQGELDELEISKAALPAGAVRLAALDQGPDASKLIQFGVDEETSSWLTGYFAVILKSVTLDGWVIIGILLVMAVMSWIVMVDKTFYLGRAAKTNTHFMKSFRRLSGDLTRLDQGDSDGELSGKVDAADRDMVRNSPLYRIYHIGAEEIAHRFNEGSSQILAPQSIAAIRSSLDAGLVRESQKLNRQMVLLTIAISGGPFLGLLGTVVGVMITFAAIAASGDVNVNAIAPGIAAALVATVAGLFVAIPALFGYNYLITRIKDVTGDMQVFVDEFTTKMAEFYRGHDAHTRAAE